MACEGHGGQANGTFFCCCGQRRSSAEGGAEGGEVAMKRRVGTGLKGDVAFGVKDESAHIGDDGAAVGEEDAKDQTDEGLAAVGQVVEGLAVLDLPEGDPVGGKRPLNVNAGEGCSTRW